MSTKVIAEPQPTPAGPPPAGAPLVRGASAVEWRVVAAVGAPVAAALVALMVHLLLPDAQTTPLTWIDGLASWQHPFPATLEAFLAVWLLLAAGQRVWIQLRTWVLHNGPLAAGAVLAFCAWDLFTLKLDWLSMPYFPGPDGVLGGMIEDRSLLFESTWRSLVLLLSGYGAGVVAGLFTGVIIGWFLSARYWVMPVLKVLGPMPATALVHVVMTVSSQPFISGAALIGFTVWFPVTMLTYSGISNVRVSYLDVARTLGAGRLYLIFRVAIPAALPNIFVGLFMGLGASFLTLIVAETVGVKAGLGWYLMWQKGYVEYGKMYAALLIMAVFFSTIMTLLFKVRDRVLKWQKGVIKW